MKEKDKVQLSAEGMRFARNSHRRGVVIKVKLPLIKVLWEGNLNAYYLHQKFLRLVRPAQTLRPGIAIDENGRRKFFCQDCKETDFVLFMVHDDLWKRTCPEDGLICLPCFVKRLGRPLAINDLKKHPLNDLVFHVVQNTAPDALASFIAAAKL